MLRVRSGVVVGVGVLLIGLAAFAQSKGRARPGRSAPAAKPPAAETNKPPAESSPGSDAPRETKAGDAVGAPAPNGEATPDAATSGDDLGAPPPKATTEDKPGTEPSPLTPAPGEFPTFSAKPPPVAYDKLLADIAALRSRVAAVTTTLFSSKLRVVVEVEGDDARVASFRVLLDDGVVYSAPERFSADEPLVVYERAVASGHHVVGVEIERYDARNRQFRTFQTSKFSVVVPENKRIEASFGIEDDSDMGVDFPDGEDGEYDLNVRLRARVID